MITIIAAIAKNNALGKNNQLLWHLPSDLKHFKKHTRNHCVIMGRKTYESLGKPLPNRENIVITRSKKKQFEGCIVVHSIQEALNYAKKDENPYIIGGAEIYKLALPYADELNLTLVHANFEADTFFPEIDSKIWKQVSRTDFKADEKHRYDYSFITFLKQKKEVKK